MDNRTLPLRALRAASVLLLACALALIALRQPPMGRVTGLCVDSATGRPLAHALVTLTPSASDGGGGGDSAGDDAATSPSPQGVPTVPAGWSQNAVSENDRDAEGASTEAPDHWSERTDAQGRFLFPHVPAGVYDISASTGDSSDPNDMAHELPDGREAVVLEGSATRLSLALDPTDPRLSFEDQEALRNWMPTENPTLPLRGLLQTRSVTVTVERLNLASALTHKVGWLAAPPSRGSDDADADAPSPSWPGAFTPVRRWTYTVSDADGEGSFFDQIPLGPLPPGMYRVTAGAHSGGQGVSAVSWALVTRLALIRKTYGSRALIDVTDIATGRPVPGAAVALYAPALIRQTRTGKDGLARLSTQGAPAESAGTLVVRDGDSVSALTMELNSPGSGTDAADASGATSTLRSFLYTDRPVYRPGQTVYLKGILRDLVPPATFTVPSGQAVTLEVRDAQDTLVSHQVLTTDAYGSWNAALTLSPEALTGDYTVQATLGGSQAQGSFDVAAYHKPEAQAVVTFSKSRYVRGETIVATVTASYYYGAPVAGAQATLSAYQTDAGTDDGGGLFAGTRGASGDDGAEAGAPARDETVRLDDNGQAVIRVPTADLPPGPGDVTYTVSASISDSSGRANVSADGSTTVAQGLFSLAATPSQEFCTAGTPLTATVQATEPSGAARPGQAVTVAVGYDSVDDGGTETFSRLTGSALTTGSDGAVTVPLPDPRAGDLQLRVTAKDTRGDVITTETDVWIQGGDRALPPRAPDLSVTLDKKRYRPGETAHALILTAHPGPAALVTVEGATLSRAFVVPLHGRATAVDLPVTAADAPAVTVSACCVWDKQFLSSSDTENLTVDDDRRALQITVSPDRPAYHPGDTATISVRTRDRQGHAVPAEVSVGVVDEAIYAIEPESTDTIGDAMEPEQTDDVQTDSSCEVATEGDVDKGDGDVQMRRRLVDTALWRPDVWTGPAGDATVSLTLPDNLTRWRITCVGDTLDTRVGKGTGEMTVSKDLLISLDTPPFLTAGDTGRCVALVHNNTARTVHARVRLAAAGLSLLNGAAVQSVDVPPGVPARLVWDVRAAQAVPAQVQVTAQAGALSDGLLQPLPVLPHGAATDVWASGTLLRRVSQGVSVDPGALPACTVLHVRLAPSLASTVTPALAYLESYPYGSTDTTVAAFLPDLALWRGADALRLDAGRRARLRDMVGRGSLRLARFQGSDGGWGWFPTSHTDLWMTADAAWGLAQAHAAGFPVNPSVLTAAARSLQSLAAAKEAHTREQPDDDAALAMAALAMARLGESRGAVPALRLLEDRWRVAPSRAQCVDIARAALAEGALGPAERTPAASLMGLLRRGARRTGSLTSWPAPFHPQAAGIAEDAPDVAATAWALLAMEQLAPTDPGTDGAARWLMTERDGDHWCDPDTTAIVVSALTQYIARSGEAAPDFTATLLVNGLPVRSVPFPPDSVSRPDQVIDIPGSALHVGENTVSLEKSGTGRLYYALDLHQVRTQPAPPAPPSLWARLAGFVAHPDGAPEPPSLSGYSVRRGYLRLTTRRNFLWEDSVPAPDTHLNAGEDMLVRLIVDCTRPGSRLVISEPVPAGCRIAEVSGEDMGDDVTDWNNWWDYTDVRDDQIVFFVQDMTRGEHEIDYHLVAQTPGVYDVMPTQITSLADPTLNALGPHADRITIDGD